jgi:serine phosphatase RsbU (regulator of sigma subunit)
MLVASVSILFENILQRHKMKSLAAMEFELATASTLQSTLLSETPVMDGWHLGTFFQPALRVGGDWYGFHHEKESGMLYIVLGDATGHGLAPAMVTVNACGAFYSALWTLSAMGHCTFANAENVLTDVLNTVSRSILRASNEEILMTCVGVAVDIKTGNGLFINAGHRPGVLRNGSTAKASSLLSPGDILGLRVSEPRPMKTFQISEGDALLLYTDGLVENEGPGKAVFSPTKLRKAVEAGTEPNKDLISSVVGKAKDVWGNEPGNDDVTLLTLTRVNSREPL